MNVSKNKKIIVFAIITFSILLFSLFFLLNNKRFLAQQEIETSYDLKKEITQKPNTPKATKSFLRLKHIKQILIQAEADGKESEILNAKKQLIENLIIISGLDRVIVEFGDNVFNSIENTISKNERDDIFKEKALEAVRQAISSEKMFEKLNEQINENISSNELKELSDHYEQPLVQKAVSLEEEYHDPSKQEELTQYILGKKQFEIDDERKNLFSKLVEENNITEIITNMTVQTQLAIYNGIKNIVPEKSNTIKEDTTSIEKQMTKSYTKHFNESFPKIYAIMYQEMSNQEIDQLTVLNRNPTTKKYDIIAMNIIKESMISFGNNLGASLKDVFDTK